MAAVSISLKDAVALGIGVLGVGFLAWGFWPAQTATAALTVGPRSLGEELANGSTISREGHPNPAGLFSVNLHYPQRVRAGDMALVRLEIVPKYDNGVPAIGADTATRQPLLFQSRLELPGMEVFPAAEITTQWSENAGAAFVWTIRSPSPSTSVGTAWIFLLPSESPNLAGDRIALAAQPIKITSGVLLGASGVVARVIGAGSVVMAAILGMPAVDALLRRPGRTERDCSD